MIIIRFIATPIFWPLLLVLLGGPFYWLATKIWPNREKSFYFRTCCIFFIIMAIVGIIAGNLLMVIISGVLAVFAGVIAIATLGQG